MMFSLKARKRLLDRNLIMDNATRTLIGQIMNGIETVLRV